MKLAPTTVGFLTALCTYVQSATFVLPNLTTTVDANASPLPSLASTNSWTVNLNDRSGLVPGSPVKITITTDDHFLWLVVFNYRAGSLEMTSTPTLSLLVGGETATVTSTLYQNFGIVPGPGVGEPVSSVGGYVTGTGLPALEVVVPWSADLTNAQIRLAQVSSILGTDARLLSSTVNISGGVVASSSSTFQVTLVSIPEPTALGLLALPMFGLLRRNRNFFVNKLR